MSQSPTIVDVENRASISFIVFVTAGASLARLSLYVATKIILVWSYGWHRVLSEHLAIVKEKPEMVVSNGDVLYGKSPVGFLIGAPLWMLCLASFMLLTSRLLPRREREALKGEYTVSGPALLAGITLFFAIGMLPLNYSLLLAVFVLVLAFLLPWVRKEIQNAR